MSNIVYLAGFMGAGKSAVAAWVKRYEGITKFESVELDGYIEKVEGTTIEGLFGSYGEDYFRDVEAKTLQEISESFKARPIQKTYIISCGGGILMKDSNVEIMKRCGKIALLTASASNIRARLSNDKTVRPLLEKCQGFEEVEALMHAREERYQEVADFTVSTDEKTVAQVWDNIKSNII